MSSLDNLTPEQREKYQQFVEFTQWKGDSDSPLALLNSTNWNVQTAIALHFDDTQAEPAQDSQSAAASSSSASASSFAQGIPTTTSLMEELNSQARGGDGTVYPPRDTTHIINYRIQEGTIFSLIQNIIFFPITLGYKIFNTSFYFLSTLFPFLPRLTGYYPANRTATRSVQKTDAKTTSLRIIRSFEETYGPTQLQFYEGGFTQAFNLAKSEFKFLVVVILSDEHDLTNLFCRQVLYDSRVVDLLNRSDTILWLGNVENSEGLQVADALKCTSFPFTQLIAPFPKTPNSLALVMKTLVTIQGETDPMKFISTLEEKMEAHTPVIASFTRDKQRVEDTQRLRQCQEDAYEQSLAIDRERERVAREEAQRAAEEEARELAARKERELAAEAKKRAKEEKKQKEQIWRAWKASQIGPEFDSATEKPARISIRMPSGERVVRKFSGNQTIDDIYAFVECYDLIKDGAVVPEPTEIPSPDYVHEYTFQLASTLPRQVIPADAGIKISDNKIIWPSASLVVEVDLSDDEEEED
ncbi:similar to Saccharomyces cerevisiae YDL091C UBX3 UBX (ubiquitin regulatory X) domain-containing protein that interacts with Cdc48p [Geotrichum candidum]|uniref:Similar to Saccharomyces cerevisiae YDL091C UBX3 UBX (Ubiquitin regulatory X) domain-containing protein that interacts with Cdc48p n=1 Tax=Geotrichum candidum TaxID=1173061 RepID=A0A0J9XFC8_GEOCN|nr:similar to Saccharomyces cerevisiae YDL091C UBX3 UBX (ubiquitin regulatory X) domain-containing protein that interacts with Cdc48p [Geotrichum candidum]